MAEDNVHHCLEQAALNIKTALLLIDEEKGVKARKYLLMKNENSVFF